MTRKAKEDLKQPVNRWLSDRKYQKARPRSWEAKGRETLLVLLLKMLIAVRLMARGFVRPRVWKDEMSWKANLPPKSPHLSWRMLEVQAKALQIFYWRGLIMISDRSYCNLNATWIHESARWPCSRSCRNSASSNWTTTEICNKCKTFGSICNQRA